MNEIKKKLIIIWTRVSSKGQSDISPASQALQCNDLLAKNGKVADLVMKPADDWKSSAELYDCPEWQKLLQMIYNDEVGTLCCFDRDRLESDPIDRQIFIAKLREMGIEILFCVGSAVIDGDMGGLVEHVYAIVKHQQVMGVRIKTPIGLKDRVTKGGKDGIPRPTSYHDIYGYDWKRPTDPKLPPYNILEPDENYENRKIVVYLALEGQSLRQIQKLLFAKGILPPSYETTHNPYWNLNTLRAIAIDPINEGKYFALKCKNIRKTYKEHAKCKRLKESNWYYMSNIEIIDPILIGEQRQQIIEQLAKHKKFARRNAAEPYLLAGMIFSEDNHTYIGRKEGKTSKVFRYTSYDQHHSIHGQKIEEAVKTKVREMFSGTDQSFWQKFTALDKVNKPQLTAELAKKKREREQIINQQANLLINAKGFNAEAIDKAKLKLDTDLFMIDKSIAGLNNQLAEADAVTERVRSFLTIKERFTDVLNNNDYVRWRELLIALDCCIFMYDPYAFDKGLCGGIDDEMMAELNQPSAKWKDGDDFSTDLPVPSRKKDEKYTAIMTLKGGRKIQSETVASISNPSIVSSVLRCAMPPAPITAPGSWCGRWPSANSVIWRGSTASRRFTTSSPAISRPNSCRPAPTKASGLGSTIRWPAGCSPASIMALSRLLPIPASGRIRCIWSGTGRRSISPPSNTSSKSPRPTTASRRSLPSPGCWGIRGLLPRLSGPPPRHSWPRTWGRWTSN